jgi:hypothetical protein
LAENACGVFGSPKAKKTPRERAAFVDVMETGPYFETDRLNMRSIFSLVASQHDWLA